MYNGKSTVYETIHGWGGDIEDTIIRLISIELIWSILGESGMADLRTQDRLENKYKET